MLEGGGIRDGVWWGMVKLFEVPDHSEDILSSNLWNIFHCKVPSLVRVPRIHTSNIDDLDKRF